MKVLLIMVLITAYYGIVYSFSRQPDKLHYFNYIKNSTAFLAVITIIGTSLYFKTSLFFNDSTYLYHMPFFFFFFF